MSANSVILKLCVLLSSLKVISSLTLQAPLKDKIENVNIPKAVQMLDKLRFRLLEIAGDITENSNPVQPISLPNINIESKQDLSASKKEPLSLQDVVNAEAKGRGGSKVISNPFAGVAPIPVDVPSDPLSGLMAMEVEDLGSQSHGRLGVETICECARNPSMLNQKMSGRIIGGTSAKPNAMPWQIFIRILKQFRCGGTLLNKKFVLSAMHCFYKIVNLESPGKDILVGAGVHDLCVDLAAPEHGWQMAYVSRIHHQGNFNERTFDNDVAILELDRSLTLNHKVLPACLPTRSYPPNSDVYISGWGQVRDDKVPCELQYLELPLHSEETCRNTELGQRYLFTAAKPYPDIQICAGHLEGGKDACQGDSGGPLVTTGFNDYIEVVGITSWGIGCGRKNSPGSYVNVLKYLDFINSTVAPGECWYRVDQNATVKVLQQALETAQAIAEKIAENGTLSVTSKRTNETFQPPTSAAITPSTKTPTATTKLPVTQLKASERSALITTQVTRSIPLASTSTSPPARTVIPQATGVLQQAISERASLLNQTDLGQNALPLQQQQQVNQTKDKPLACKYQPWVMNGYCDDLANIPECNFDGGDCCNRSNPKWNFYCKKCQCLNVKKVITLPDGRTTIVPTGSD